jgi:MFS family permease
VTLAALDFGAVAVNLAFYAYAFDELKVTTGYWGLMLSILYGMNLVSMAVLMRFKKYFQSRAVLLKAAVCILAVSAVWCFYSLTGNPALILLGAALEGLFTSLSTTLLTTALMQSAGERFTARVMSVRDLLSNALKLAGAGMTYVMLLYFKPPFVFSVSAVTLFTFGVALIAWLLSGSPKQGRSVPALSGSGRSGE